MKALPKLLTDTFLNTISVAETVFGKRIKISTYLHPSDQSEFYFYVKSGKIITKECLIIVNHKKLTDLYTKAIVNSGINPVLFLKKTLQEARINEIEEHNKQQIKSITNHLK